MFVKAIFTLLALSILAPLSALAEAPPLSALFEVDVLWGARDDESTGINFNSLKADHTRALSNSNLLLSRRPQWVSGIGFIPGTEVTMAERLFSKSNEAFEISNAGEIVDVADNGIILSRASQWPNVLSQLHYPSGVTVDLPRGFRGSFVNSLGTVLGETGNVVELSSNDSFTPLVQDGYPSQLTESGLVVVDNRCFNCPFEHFVSPDPLTPQCVIDYISDNSLAVGACRDANDWSIPPNFVQWDQAGNAVRLPEFHNDADYMFITSAGLILNARYASLYFAESGQNLSLQPLLQEILDQFAEEQLPSYPGEALLHYVGGAALMNDVGTMVFTPSLLFLEEDPISGTSDLVAYYASIALRPRVSSTYLHAYIEGAITCRYDFTGDNQVDVTDFAEFLSRFGTNDPFADFDANGQVDVLDFSDFADHFGPTCG